MINQTRVTVPKFPEGIIRRDDLLAKLKENCNKKLIVISGPAGYGKTTLVIDHIYRSAVNYAWMQIKKDINSIYLFYRYVIGSLQKINAGFGTDTLKYISQIEEDSSRIPEPDRAIDQITVSLTNEFLFHFTEDVILVLDDLHEVIPYAWHRYLLETLINETPHNLHLAITSRSLPEINLSTLRSKRNIFEVTKKDLLFARNEIELLAKDLYDKVYSEDELNYFEKFIGGWVTGIHLMIQAYDERNSLENLNPGFIPENLFDYFANEIFEKQTADTRRFLIYTAHFDDFDEELCNSLPGIKNSSETLKYLSGKNIFIESITHERLTSNTLIKYSYNQLFRNFLLNKSANELSETDQKALYIAIAGVFEKKENHDEASRYFQLAGNSEKAENQLVKCFDQMFHNGQFEKLWELISGFTEDKISESRILLYYSSLLWKYYKGDINIALDFVNKAIAKIENDSDENFMVSCMITKSEFLLNQSKVTEVMEILSKLENKDITPKNKAKILFYLGNANFTANKYDISENYLKKSLELCERHSLTELEPDIYNLLGNINIIKGEFVLSKHYYELTITKTGSQYKKLVAAGNLAILHSRSGKFQKAKEYLDDSKELVTLFRTPIFDLVIKMIEYTLLFEMADYDSAFLTAKDINKRAIKLNNNHYISLSYQFLGEVSYYLGNTSNSIEYYKIAEKYIDEGNETEKIILDMLETISQKENFSDPSTETSLLRAYTYQDASGYNYDKTSAGYHLSRYYYLNGQPSTAVKYLEKTIGLAREKEYYGFLIREYLYSRDLFDLLKKNNIDKSLSSTIIDYISDISELSWINSTHRESLRTKLDGFYDIRLTVFGNPGFTVRGAKIDETKWKRKKHKLLLCTLFVSNNRQMTKDRIIDTFFRDSSVDSSDNLFHQAVSNIRSSLKSARSDDDPSKQQDNFILYEGKSLKLNPDYLYLCDMDEFDELLNKSIDTTENSGKIMHLKAALQLYKGDLFEGYYEEWCESLREEYRNKYISCIERLLELLEEEKQFTEIPLFAEKLILFDKLNSIGHSALVWALLNQGKKQSAKDKYDQFVKACKTELGEDVPPGFKKRFETVFN